MITNSLRQFMLKQAASSDMTYNPGVPEIGLPPIEPALAPSQSYVQGASTTNPVTPKTTTSTPQPRPVTATSAGAGSTVQRAMSTPTAKTFGKGMGLAAVLNAPGAVIDTWDDWTLENASYAGQAKPWLETAQTVAGLGEASTDMFDEVGSTDFWKALPGEALDSGLDTGKQMFVNPIVRGAKALGPGVPNPFKNKTTLNEREGLTPGHQSLQNQMNTIPQNIPQLLQRTSPLKKSQLMKISNNLQQFMLKQSKG